MPSNVTRRQNNLNATAQIYAYDALNRMTERTIQAQCYLPRRPWVRWQWIRRDRLWDRVKWRDFGRLRKLFTGTFNGYGGGSDLQLLQALRQH